MFRMFINENLPLLWKKLPLKVTLHVLDEERKKVLILSVFKVNFEI